MKNVSRLLYVCLLLTIVSCAGTPKFTPHFMDTDLSRCREYQVVNTDTYEIKFVKSWPLSKCNGYFAMPPDEARLWKEFLMNKKAEQQ